MPAVIASMPAGKCAPSALQPAHEPLRNASCCCCQYSPRNLTQRRRRLSCLSSSSSLPQAPRRNVRADSPAASAAQCSLHAYSSPATKLVARLVED